MWPAPVELPLRVPVKVNLHQCTLQAPGSSEYRCCLEDILALVRAGWVRWSLDKQATGT